ncbi:MAG: PucR family transcriptional regulator [Motilibacteraceae bacterium]
MDEPVTAGADLELTGVTADVDGAGHLPPDDGLLARLTASLVDGLPGLLGEVAALLDDGWPDYARFLREHHGQVLGAAASAMPALVTIATRTFVDSDAAGDPEVAPRLFEQIGAVHARAGRELTPLLAAYNVGARAAWRHVAAAGVRAHAPQQILTALAEAVFAFVGQLSAATTRGYVHEQSESLVARERRRDELAEMLLTERSTLPQLQTAAQRAGWPLPREAAVVLVPRQSPLADTLGSRFDPGWLPVRRTGLVGAIVPDAGAPAKRQRIASRLAGCGVVVGRAVPLDELPSSARMVAVALRLVAEQVLEGGEGADPVFVEDHLDTVLVHQDGRALALLREVALAPLDECTPATRDRLEETLCAWLGHQRDQKATARALHVHPQTVRYRLGQLEELFGRDLHTPDGIRRLTLATCWGAPNPVHAVAGALVRPSS